MAVAISRQAINDAAVALADITPTPRLDAELLMAHAMGVSREDLLLRHLDDAVPTAFATLLARRLGHEPVAYITGTRTFWTIALAVGPGVLVPRADSETLIEAAVAYFHDRAPPSRILDLGTGPGTLLLAALAQWPQAQGLGIDASAEALGYAQRNADALGLAGRARFQTGDWTKGLSGQFDLILSNPPYIGTDEDLPREVRDHEPGVALFAGPEGLDAYRAIIPALPRLLAPQGIAVIEIGHTQAVSVGALTEAVGLAATVHHDLGRRPRALVLS